MKDTGELEATELGSVSDEILFEEVASRLKRQYRKEHGLDFQFGCFEFTFHNGRFQGIEERPRERRYRSPGPADTRGRTA